MDQCLKTGLSKHQRCFRSCRLSKPTEAEDPVRMTKKYSRVTWPHTPEFLTSPYECG